MSEQSLLLVACGQVASLAFLFYDMCLTFDDEINLIWSKPNRSWIKWQFLFTRYFALAAQILSRTIECMAKSNTIFSRESFKIWYMCQVLLGCTLMTAVEVVLMARVYALYNKKTWVGLVFAALIMSEATAVTIGMVENVPENPFEASNVLLTSPNSYTYFGISAIVSQITILVFTLVKYSAAIRGGWGKVPIMMLMVRDGTAIFLSLLAITTLTVIASNLQTPFESIGNSWFLSVVACAGCRLIINMQYLPVRPEPATNCPVTTIQLTTLWNEIDNEAPHRDPPPEIQCVERSISTFF